MSVISRTCLSSSNLPRDSRKCSSSIERSKWSSIERLPRPVMIRMSVMPAATASSITYWIVGLSTIGSISLGDAFVAGRNRVPNPAAGMTAFVNAMGAWRSLRTGRIGGKGRALIQFLGADDAVASPRLGRIHRLIGRIEQLFGRLAVLGIHRVADRDADVEGGPTVE